MPDKYSVLKQYFGYDNFREGQEALIDAILSGKDALGVMPTGAGKSVCFQVPAMLMDGITLVISPLISLMKDQVHSLTQAGIKSAYLNSSLSAAHYRRALEYARDGVYKIIYVAPERLENDEFLDFASSVDISMLTVDEAHCISQWGQDFRPSYLRIRAFIGTLAKRPVLSAFTATATTRVRQDILDSLSLRDPKVLVSGFDRKNLSFEVKHPGDKFRALTAFLSERWDKSGIIYCSTRKTVDEVWEKLCNKGCPASRYHAGLSDTERRENQEDFIYDRRPVMVATNAFGMGIDKSNVSYVLHYNMPMNLEGYYQEAGRAGRDGSEAECVMFYHPQDVRINKFLIDHSRDAEYPDSDTEQLIKSRDHDRLRIMTNYCYTTDCLRAYILNYFGERTAPYCGNCSSCNQETETIDITTDAKKVLSCVYRMGENFGAKMVNDVLLGVKSERIRSLKFDELSTYGIINASADYIRNVINYLIFNGFLVATTGEYPVIKLGQRAGEVLKGGLTLEMKQPKAAEREAAPSKAKRTKVRTVEQPQRSVNPKLLLELKIMRTAIANAQMVPAYTIFPDTSLVDMCLKLPSTQEEFKKVMGVGQVKLEKYGERFLEIIKPFLPVRGNAESEIVEAESVQDYNFSEEPITVSAVSDLINAVRIQNGKRKVTAQKIGNWLECQGYLKMSHLLTAANSRMPTEKGKELGITSHQRDRNSGERYYINLYNLEAQKFIAENSDSMAEGEEKEG